MQIQSQKLWLGRQLALSALILTVTGCFNALVGDADVCVVGDAGYAVGEKYKVDCNTCTCEEDGTSSCTLIACDVGEPGDASVPDPGNEASCTYGGKQVASGQTVTTGKDCEACTCYDGKLDCRYYACPSDGAVPICYFDGGAYAPGWFASGDCKCECRMDGKVSCDPSCATQTDAGAPDYDAGKPDDAGVIACEYNGKSFTGTILTGDLCNTCTCANGKSFCTMSPCLPDGGAGSCEILGKQVPVGTQVYTGIECNTCDCVADGKVYCQSQSCGPTQTDAGVPTPGICEYNGMTYKVGESFLHEDKCNKCACTMNGLIECSSISCMRPSGCTLGDKLFSVGEELVCADGCNTCSCGSKTDPYNWSMTKIACPALPPIVTCPTDISVSAFSAQFVYREGDALAVVDSRCVNGQTLDYGLCWQDGSLDKGFADLYVYATGGQRACNVAASERVFSLVPLRQALVAALPNQPYIKASLRGSGGFIGYDFMAP